ncbi:hypothetical protein CRM22_002177 [Opisthorchis felineus]|uniref:Nucleotide exchange factor SIL1 n=1 Tax=Opisthorchis felineus TaxID=147828 RepID=A0A4S2M7M6_OPIFE|nr:hypothetical protein CRM22_002177 [Opisthorchis felineus]
MYLFVVLLVMCISSHGEDATLNDTVFIPTHEWQIVQPGQQLPPSLHIRHDLKTGITEAKLMDPEEHTSENMLSPVSKADNASVSRAAGNHSAFSKPDFNPFLLPYIEEELDESYIQRVKSKFRSYDELKADFQKINAQVKTDFEILMEIMESLNVSDISGERLSILLEDLSYLLHQVDNGRLFSENEGFTLLRRFISHPNITIQKRVLSSMSAALQGNSDVKVVALQSGLLDMLCLKLRNCTNSAYPPDESVTLMASALTTLSALLRDFPSAQKYFFSMDPAIQPLQAGFDLLATLYDYKVDGEILRNKMSRIRIQLHLLVSDLVLERTNAKQMASLPSEQNNKRLVKLYSETEFESAVARSGWCDRLYHSLLHDMPRRVSADSVNTISTHGPRQELLSATLHLHPFCDEVQPEVYSLFQELEQEYAAFLAIPENKDDLFFQDMLNLVVRVRKLFDEPHASRRATDEL